MSYVVLHRDIPSSSQWMMVATVVSSIAYGFVVSLYICCCRALLAATEKYSPRKRRVLFSYITIMTLLSTLALVQEVSSTIFNTSILPQAFISSAIQSSPWVLPFTIWGADAFKTWRCVALYYAGISRGPRILLMCLLGFFSLMSIVSGILLLASPFVPGRALGFTATPLFMVTLSAISNPLLSTLIGVRIFVHRSSMRTAFGPSYGAIYTRIIIMCIESCALIVFGAVAYIILYFTKSQGSPVALFLIPHFCVISPLFIVYRVVEGREDSTTSCLTNIVERGFSGLGPDISFKNRSQISVQSSAQSSHPTSSVTLEIPAEASDHVK